MHITISIDEDTIKYILVHSFLDARIFLLCPALTQTLFNRYLAIKFTKPSKFRAHLLCWVIGILL